ncbi:MarR family winged helix-turn-helix transcriptional regulator [Alicyclobacillus fodiniaquatilis]|jgi:DNA-binding MarR family transcriptional regulator|uniref:MarR family winged helix-turn-helix transcriptional regulator n=1 Tax=Alicyclobacillus fodiniaquatilis TaxID=1661150 RepID=A0ABW4JC62_9BACL
MVNNDSIEKNLLDELAALVRHVTSFTTYKNDSNLDRSGYLLLNHIVTHGPTGVKALAEQFGLHVSTISRQSTALEQKGYVVRVPDPVDGRAFSFEITALGEKELNLYKQVRRTRMTKIIEDWTTEERQTFVALLQKFNRGF